MGECMENKVSVDMIVLDIQEKLGMLRKEVLSRGAQIEALRKEIADGKSVDTEPDNT